MGQVKLLAAVVAVTLYAAGGIARAEEAAAPAAQAAPAEAAATAAAPEAAAVPAAEAAPAAAAAAPAAATEAVAAPAASAAVEAAPAAPAAPATVEAAPAAPAAPATVEAAPAGSTEPSTAPAAAVASDSPVAAVEAEPGEAPKNPWAGSVIAYEHTASAISLDKGAELTWNPYYAHSVSIRPEWSFNEYLVTRLRLDIEQELTNSDDTTRKNEWLFSDLIWDLDYKGWKEPNSGIKLAAGLRTVFPLSKLAHSQSLRLALAPGVSASRKFEVLEGLTIKYAGRLTKYFHKYTTTQFDAPGIACGRVDGPECGRFVHSGVRNASTQLSHGPSLAFEPIKNLSIGADMIFRKASLYELTPVTVGTLSGDVAVGGEENDIPYRWSDWFIFDVSYQALDYLGVSVGISTLYPELGADGQLRDPFFNRFTNFYVDLTVDIDSVVSLF